MAFTARRKVFISFVAVSVVLLVVFFVYPAARLTELQHRAEAFVDSGEYVKAEAVYARILSLEESKFGEDHLNITFALFGLAEVYEAQGKYGEAKAAYNRVLRIEEQILGTTDIDVGVTLDALGRVNYHQGLYSEAEPLFLRSLAIYEAVHGADHPDVALILNNLAELYRTQGRYPEAEPLYRRSFAIYEAALGADHPAVAVSLNNVALLYYAQGRYSEAEPLFLRSLAIYEAVHGADHPDVATSLNNLAELYRTQGRYSEAEPLYQRSLAIYEAALGADHQNVAMSLNNVALLYYAQGRYSEAEPLFLRSLAIYEAVHGEGHPSVATSLNNLALLYNAQGRYSEAEPLYQRSLAIYEAALGADHPNVAMSLNNVALLYYAQGRYSEAEPLYLRSFAIYEAALGSDHPSVAMGLNNLALLYDAQGRYSEAEPLYQRSLAIYEATLGADHPDVATSLVNIAGLYFALESPVKALGYTERAFAVDAAIRAESFATLSEIQRMDFVAFRGNPPLRIAASLAIEDHGADAPAVSATWKMVLRSKGVVLDSVLEDRQNLAGNPEAQEVFSRLDEVKTRISTLQTQMTSAQSQDVIENLRPQVDLLSSQQQELEQQLARLSGRFREGRRASMVTPEQVAAALPESSVLVEFLHMRPLARPRHTEEGFTWDELPDGYLAFVLKPGASAPIFVRLGEAEPIDELIREVHRKLSATESAMDELRRLHRMVWGPLAPHVGETERVLISPDGVLNQLSFAALRGPDGRYLVERHEIAYVASGRDLIRDFSDAQSTTSPALFGDPLFGELASVEQVEQREKMIFRSMPVDRDRALYGGLGLSPLPHTRIEVELISATLSEQKPSVFLGASAAEENFKAQVRPKLLHLATHGFYLDAADDGGEKPQQGNPMHRSGLLLAGAQLALVGKVPPDREDGVVTAEEVGGLDLWGTQLVVLSACNTGQGETLTGEGVLGLRRAFVQAGAQNLILTLWRVEDGSTRDLMIAFYRDFLESGDAVGAMSRAQRKLATELSPAYWAPFVMSVQGREMR